jgi:hypothetical protein
VKSRSERGLQCCACHRSCLDLRVQGRLCAVWGWASQARGNLGTCSPALQFISALEANGGLLDFLACFEDLAAFDTQASVVRRIVDPLSDAWQLPGQPG